MHASSWHCYDINCSVSHAEHAKQHYEVSKRRLHNWMYEEHSDILIPSVSCITDTNLFAFRSKSLHIRGTKKYDPVTTNCS
jgi:hypothetical protein